MLEIDFRCQGGYYNIMSETATAIFKKLNSLEQQVQKLKVEAYLNLPKNKQTVSFYPQETINKALTSSRNQIWRDKYAKKVKGLS